MRSHKTVEESEDIFKRAGLYSASLLNDIKVDGKWVRSITVGSTTSLTGKRAFPTRAYSVWNGINSRSAKGGSFQRKFPHYVGTTICESWANDFDTFADWYTSQIGYKEGWDIDKDVLSGGKHYSPSTCMLLPRVLNLLVSSRHITLNVIKAPTQCNPDRYRTLDKNTFENIKDALAHARAVKLHRIETLRKEYHYLPPVVFDKALALVP